MIIKRRLIINAEYEYTQDDLDNHSDQLNPNNDAYWQSRGHDERPEEWEETSETHEDESWW